MVFTDAQVLTTLCEAQPGLDWQLHINGRGCHEAPRAFGPLSLHVQQGGAAGAWEVYLGEAPFAVGDLDDGASVAPGSLEQLRASLILVVERAESAAQEVVTALSARRAMARARPWHFCPWDECGGCGSELLFRPLIPADPNDQRTVALVEPNGVVVCSAPECRLVGVWHVDEEISAMFADQDFVLRDGGPSAPETYQDIVDLHLLVRERLGGGVTPPQNYFHNGARIGAQVRVSLRPRPGDVIAYADSGELFAFKVQ